MAPSTTKPSSTGTPRPVPESTTTYPVPVLDRSGVRSDVFRATQWRWIQQFAYGRSSRRRAVSTPTLGRPLCGRRRLFGPRKARSRQCWCRRSYGLVPAPAGQASVQIYANQGSRSRRERVRDRRSTPIRAWPSATPTPTAPGLAAGSTTANGTSSPTRTPRVPTPSTTPSATPSRRSTPTTNALTSLSVQVVGRGL